MTIKSSTKMDLAVPSQLLEISNIHMMPFTRKEKYPPIATLQYNTPQLNMKHCSILTPILKIVDWNPIKGRLRLNCDNHSFFQTKMAAIQEYLINTIHTYQNVLLNGCEFESAPDKRYTRDEIRSVFKVIFEEPFLTCYISPHHLFPLYAGGERVGLQDFNGLLRSGVHIRLILQLNGVSHLPGNSFRIQHQILGAYIIDT